MRKAIQWIARVAFGSGVALALAFGALQAMPRDGAAQGCTFGTCPDLDACISCCIVNNGSGGACVGPFFDICLCEGG